MENQNHIYKYNKDYIGILKFRQDLIQQQSQILTSNTCRSQSPRQTVQQPNTKQIRQSDYILLNLSAVPPNDIIDTKGNPNNIQKAQDSSLINHKQFLPFIQERDSVGRLINRDNQSLHSSSNGGDITDKSKQEAYKQLLKKVTMPKMAQSIHQKRESSLCLNQMLNDFLEQQKAPFSVPTSTQNLQEHSTNFKKGFIIKEDKVSGYCNELDRISPFLRDQRLKRQSINSGESGDIKGIASRQSNIIPPLSHKRHSSDISITLAQLAFRNLNSNSNNNSMISNKPQIKNINKIQTPFNSQSNLSLLQKNLRASYLDKVHNSARQAQFSLFNQKPLESNHQISQINSRIIHQNDHDLSDAELKQIIGRNSSKNQSQFASADDKTETINNFDQNQDTTKETKSIQKQNGAQDHTDKMYTQILNLSKSNLSVPNTNNTLSMRPKQAKIFRKPSIEQSTNQGRTMLNYQSQKVISQKNVSSSYFVKGNSQRQQQNSQQKEKDETFSELFKGVKVTQLDIDKYIKNDLAYFGNIKHQGEEKIANFSQDNISSFMSEMQILKNRARKLKKNINQMPESAMTNLRDVDSEYNSKHKIPIQF